MRGGGRVTGGPIGLYDPANEHDACGVAFVVDMHGRRSRDIVDKAITALLNLERRGAAGAEVNSGDGAGILIQLPDTFFRAILAEEGAGFELPPEGAVHSAALLMTLHLRVPSARVRQQVTEPGRPHVERTAQRTTGVRQCDRRRPARAAALATRATQST